MGNLRESLKEHFFHLKLFFPWFLSTIIVCIFIAGATYYLLKKNADYMLVEALRLKRSHLNNAIQQIEKKQQFYGRFMADMGELADQYAGTKLGRSMQVYLINFLRAKGMRPYPLKAVKDNKAYEKLVRKGLIGINSTELVEQRVDDEFVLSIDSVTPVETKEGVKEALVISTPLTQNFLDELKMYIGKAELFLIYKNSVILSSMESPLSTGAILHRFSSLPPDIKVDLLTGNMDYLAEYTIGGNRVKVLFFPLTVNYANVGVFALCLPIQTVFYTPDRGYGYLVVNIALVLAILGVLYFLLSYKLAYPFKLLSETSGKMDLGRKSNVGGLQRSFDTMAENVQRMTVDLQRTNQEIMEWNRALEKKVEEQSNKLHEVKEKLSQAEKLSALGELVSGVAHEINNPLSSIIGFAQILEMEQADREAREDLSKIIHEAKRAGKIVKNLLTYARKNESVKQLTQINELIRHLVDLRAYEWQTSNIKLVQELDPALPLTMVDAGQIEQVLLNIMNNAEQAIHEKKPGGTITVSSRRGRGEIIIKISDDGAGIPRDRLSKIYDPFYTTKEVGKGTGLGLSVSYGIIEAHNGKIRVETEIAKGTTFIITLPLVEDFSSPAQRDKQRAGDNLLGGKKVLVLDDEEEILDILTRFLEGNDCFVATAVNGKEGLARLRAESFDLVICDIKMPVMDGKAFYAIVSAEMPNMAERVVFATGDLVGKATRAFIESTRAGHIGKPFELQELKRVLCEAIAATRKSNKHSG